MREDRRTYWPKAGEHQSDVPDGRGGWLFLDNPRLTDCRAAWGLLEHRNRERQEWFSASRGSDIARYTTWLAHGCPSRRPLFVRARFTDTVGASGPSTPVPTNATVTTAETPDTIALATAAVAVAQHTTAQGADAASAASDVDVVAAADDASVAAAAEDDGNDGEDDNEGGIAAGVGDDSAEPAPNVRPASATGLRGRDRAFSATQQRAHSR